jgi:hypothetical protein
LSGKQEENTLIKKEEDTLIKKEEEREKMQVSIFISIADIIINVC